MSGGKTCYVCGGFKKLRQFSRTKYNKDGYKIKCRECEEELKSLIIEQREEKKSKSFSIKNKPFAFKDVKERRKYIELVSKKLKEQIDLKFTEELDFDVENVVLTEDDEEIFKEKIIVIKLDE